MRKEEQLNINRLIEAKYDNIENESVIRAKRLRTCSACVYETENYYILKSYYTYVAFIDKRDGVLYDCLRYVYGYTSTSAQQIAKFRQDYCAKSTLTWRGV